MPYTAIRDTPIVPGRQGPGSLVLLCDPIVQGHRSRCPLGRPRRTTVPVTLDNGAPEPRLLKTWFAGPPKRLGENSEKLGEVPPKLGENSEKLGEHSEELREVLPTLGEVLGKLGGLCSGTVSESSGELSEFCRRLSARFKAGARSIWETETRRGQTPPSFKIRNGTRVGFENVQVRALRTPAGVPGHTRERGFQKTGFPGTSEPGQARIRHPGAARPIVQGHRSHCPVRWRPPNGTMAPHGTTVPVALDNGAPEPCLLKIWFAGPPKNSEKTRRNSERVPPKLGENSEEPGENSEELGEVSPALGEALGKLGRLRERP